MAAWSTTVNLTPEQYAQLDHFVQQGRFASAQDAAEQLLGQVLEDEQVTSYSPAEFAELQQGFDEAKRGEFVDPEEVKAFFESWRNEARRSSGID